MMQKFVAATKEAAKKEFDFQPTQMGTYDMEVMNERLIESAAGLINTNMASLLTWRSQFEQHKDAPALRNYRECLVKNLSALEAVIKLLQAPEEGYFCKLHEQLLTELHQL
jgi:hypothetical protein